MQVLDRSLVLSPSDLVGHLECAHLTGLELAAARGELVRPRRDDPELDVLRKRGLEHEERWLERLKAEGREVVEISCDGRSTAELRRAAAATRAAMEAGADAIYQATFFDGRWLGYADFLLRVDAPSALGRFSYEPYDTKLARRVKVAAVLQLAAYSEQLAVVQGVLPEHLHVVLGEGSVKSYRLGDIAAYHRRVKGRLEERVLGDSVSTYPQPVSHCRICRWSEGCDRRRRADDHLCLVAGMRRDHTRRLVEAGIPTVSSLAATPVELTVKGVGARPLARLRDQARLQVEQRKTGEVTYELLPPEERGRGLSALPPPSPGDLFFDLEGDPYAVDGGLEYLWGAVSLPGDASGGHEYTTFWAHSPAEEKRAFESFVDFVMARLERHPDLHIYHYGFYEPAVLKRLMATHATREDEVDELLRRGVLVDLYKVVRQGVRVSQESYSIKKLEPLYMDRRTEAITEGASSIVAYERWLDEPDPTILNELAAYNEADCVSAWRLRDWLEARRDEAAATFGEPLPRPAERDTTVSDEQLAANERTQALAAALLSGVPDDRADRDAEQHARFLLAHLLQWHRREAKPEWWSWFDRLTKSDEELVNDSDAIGELAYDGEVGREKRSLLHRYRFDPAQEHKIKVGDTPLDPRTEQRAGTVAAVDSAHGTVELRRSERSEAPHPRSLVPDRPIDTKVLRLALERVAEAVLDRGIDGPGPYRAVRDLLLGRPPRIAGVDSGARLAGDHESPADAARRLGLALDETCLPVQGPPGSGKTWTAARMIVELVRAGRRVGVTATSHKAIGNLLDEVCKVAAAEGVDLRAVQKADNGDRCTAACVHCTENAAEVESLVTAGEVDVVAGTQWLFSRGGMVGAFDVIVVDEAGQMSLANVVALGPAATNLVLVGDPQQLAQPSRAHHPPGVGRSALEHVLGEHATVPPDRGLFLATTWRLHPDVCRFVSDAFYEGRLEADPSCEKQLVSGNAGLGGTGLRFVPVEHAGNRSVAPEEVDVVAGLVEELVGRQWTDCHGVTRTLAIGDILVVAPYNAQVARLCAELPEGARVGTVDKFQGQEAPVVIFSMASSSADELPRHMSFLYSRNRLNVAVSRARALAFLVCSPALLDVRCRTPYEITLANSLCRFVELAESVAL